MAEETTIRPEGVVTSEAPRSQLSTGDIVGPYQQLAHGLDKLGQGFEDIAVPLAERAGANAVTRDAEGNIKVEPHWPIFGKAGEAYSNAVKMGALAEADGAGQRAMVSLGEQYRADPDKFQNAGKAYIDNTVDQVSSVAGPEVSAPLRRRLEATMTQQWRGISNEQHRVALATATSNMDQGMADAEQTLMTLARNDPDKAALRPEWDAALDKWNTLADAKASNPEIPYDQTTRARDMQELQDKVSGQRFLYNV